MRFRSQSLKKKEKRGKESEVIILCGQGIWINSFLFINGCEMKLTQVYAANLSSIQQNMQKDAARPACVELLWPLKRKKHPQTTPAGIFHKKKIFVCASHVSAN